MFCTSFKSVNPPFSFAVFLESIGRLHLFVALFKSKTFRKPLNKQVLDDDDIVQLNSYLGLSQNVPRSIDSDAVEEV